MEPRRIGLTGGIGSGKSSVAALLADHDVPVLDLDQVGREVVKPGSIGLQKLVDRFGQQILDADGALDRKALADRCFSSQADTLILNSILHPLIYQAEALWLQQQSCNYALIEASVLLESGGVSRMDAVIIVFAEESVRLQRVLGRGDRSERQFHDIVKRQCSDEKRRATADYMIENNGSMDQLAEQVNGLYLQLNRIYCRG